MKRNTLILLSSIFAMLLLSGCQRAYYGAMEKFGVHKRDILVDRVEDARDTQNEAKEQFASAHEQFSAVLNFQGGELEDKYKTLNAEYKLSEEKAKAVAGRIEAVKDVAIALFHEWEQELNEYQSPALRKASEQKLGQTRMRYTKLIAAMERARDKIAPVLSAFKDQVLFLKHNLNAQAVASLQDELNIIEGEIAILIREMEKSINEADAFIKSMTAQQ